MSNMGKDGGLSGRLAEATIVPGEAVFDAASALADAVAIVVADLTLDEPIVVREQLRRADDARRAAWQFERAVVTQAARGLGVFAPAVRVEPKIRMLNAATNARRDVVEIAGTIEAAIEGNGQVRVDATVAAILDAIGGLQKLARLIEQAAREGGSTC